MGTTRPGGGEPEASGRPVFSGAGDHGHIGEGFEQTRMLDPRCGARPATCGTNERRSGAGERRSRRGCLPALTAPASRSELGAEA
jgi:hypothetical protein